MKELKVNPLFRDKIPPLTDDEFKRLEENIVSDGVVRDPLVTWKGTIIDGHNRWKIIQKHPEIPYSIKEMDFADEWAAIAWMCGNQLGRRNVTPLVRANLIKQMYEARQKSHGGDRRSEDFSSGENLHLNEKPINRTRYELAKELNTTEGEIRSAVEFGRGLDAAEEVLPGFRDKVLAGEVKVTKAAIESLRNLDEEAKKKAVSQIISGEYKTQKPKQTESIKSVAEIYKDMTNKEKEIDYTIDDFLEELGFVVSDFERKVSRMFENRKSIVESNAASVTEVMSGVNEFVEKVLREI